MFNFILGKLKTVVSRKKGPTLSCRTLSDMKLKGKRILLRVDFNVPLKDGKITDDNRILEALPTINYILKQMPKQLIIMSHLGRPDGKPNPSMSLKPVADRLGELISMPIKMTENCMVEKLPDDCVILLENLRFHAEEEANDEAFGKKLASYADIYVNDAFGTAHRGHASNDAITKFIPGCVGLLMEKEIANLGLALEPEHPYVAIMAGAKGDKLKVFEQLSKKADKLMFGGVLANTLLLASGKDIGASIYDNETKAFAESLLKESKDKIVMPIDVMVANKVSAEADTKVVGVDEVNDHWMILDIGPKTIEKYETELAKAKVVSWNGPLGMFEIDKFSNGTKSVAEFLARAKARTIVGGGDSAAAVIKYGLKDKMAHVSTGGGASLEFLSGKKLPAIAALETNKEKFKI